MKKLLMIVLVLSAAGAYSQEIRMPDEKRKDYVDERDKKESTTNAAKQRDMDAERQRRAELARKKRAEAAGVKQAATGNPIYCIIREMSNPIKPNPKVSIHFAEKFESHVKMADKETQKKLMVLLEKNSYASGLDALGSLTQSDWSLVESSVYSFEDMAVREYLMEFQLPVR